MNEENTQVEFTPQDTEMSDDEHAASLGYITTLAEGMLPQDDMNTAEGEEIDGEVTPGEAVDEKKDIEGNTPGTPKKDEAQDAEIADIRAQLEQLLAQENDQEGENTTTA